MGKQRTTQRVGAPVADAEEWESVDWAEARRQVRRLQVRIAKAVKEGRWGFTFLGQHFRKHGRVLHITPPVEAVRALKRKLGTLIRKHVRAPMANLIQKLNQTLRGWANYHRHVVSSEAFSRIDTYVYEQLWRMLHRRHPHKTKGWLIRNYWTAAGRKWVFAVRRKNKHGRWIVHALLRLFRCKQGGRTCR